MKIEVLFFGALREMAGEFRRKMDLPEGATVGDLVSLITQEIPQMRGYARSIAVSVNQEYAKTQTVLHTGDEVGLLPPVSGGSDGVEASAGQRRTFIVRETIDSQKVIAGIKAASDGAVVVFDGIVRDNSRGRRTTHLEYEAYEEMAVKQLDAVAETALKTFPIRDAIVFHRLGRLNVGETSVLIVVAAAHRAAAFEACRWIIDELKRRVPIWKKEFFEDGAVWADGEPFPSDISTRPGSAGRPE